MVYRWRGFKDDVRASTAAARAVAMEHHHAAVEPIHLLIGVLRPGETTAAAVLTEMSTDVMHLRDRITQALAPAAATGPLPNYEVPYTDAAKAVLELGMQEAAFLDHDEVGSEHLLLGVLREDGIAARLLQDAGVMLNVLRSRLKARTAD